ncbi:MAG: creatininase family protein [Granulosicoccaceae bacterium]
MSRGSPGAFAAQLSWPELEQRMQAGAVAVLPVGAACKAHGPHLPMNADFLQAEWLAGALVQRANVLVWPTLGYGYYPAFTDYPGSVSLARETFERVVYEILSDIRHAGARAVLIINTGISTIAPLQGAIAGLSAAIRCQLVNVYAGPHYRRVVDAIEEQPCGGHADEIETSMLLAIDRQHVALDKARAWTPTAAGVAGPFSRSDPANPRYSPAGVWGDPTLASEDKGQRLLAAIVEDLLAAIEGLAQ